MKKLDDQKFKDILRPLNTEEYEQLRSDIQSNGCLDPTRVWKGKDIVIDGHNRYAICNELNLEYKIEELGFENEQEVKEYIYVNQMGRRNITREQKRYYIGKLYETMVGKRGGARGQNVHLENVSKKLADKHKINEKTVRRSQSYAQSIDKVAVVDSKVAKDILSGEVQSTYSDVLNLGEIESEYLKHSVDSISTDVRDAFTTKNKIKKRKMNVQHRPLSNDVIQKIDEILKNEKYDKLEITSVKENANVRTRGNIITYQSYSLKNKLISFINKYSLNGIIYIANWKIKKNALETEVVDIDKKLMCRIKMSNVRHSIPKQKIGLGEIIEKSDTTKLLLNILKNISDNVKLEFNDPFLVLRDGSFKTSFITKKSIPENLTKFNIPNEWDVETDLDYRAIESCKNVFSKMKDIYYFYFRNDDGKLKVKVFNDRGETEFYISNIKSQNIKSAKFSTKHFLNILKASPFPSKIEIKLKNEDESVLLWIHIIHDGDVCDYYMIGEV